MQTRARTHACTHAQVHASVRTRVRSGPSVRRFMQVHSCVHKILSQRPLVPEITCTWHILASQPQERPQPARGRCLCLLLRIPSSEKTSRAAQMQQHTRWRGRACHTHRLHPWTLFETKKKSVRRVIQPAARWQPRKTQPNSNDSWDCQWTQEEPTNGSFRSKKVQSLSSTLNTVRTGRC